MSFISMRIISGIKVLPGIALLLVCALNVQLTHAKSAYGRFSPSLFSVDEAVVIVGWDTNEGQARLARSRYKTDYLQIAHHFQPQMNPLYCGVASSVIVLNSMRLPRGAVPDQNPVEVEAPANPDGGWLEYPAYSQQSLLGDRTESVKPRAVIEMKSTGDGAADPGLTLAQLKGILEAYDATVELYYADKNNKAGMAAFRTTVRQVLQESQQFILVNFHGRSIGTPTNGHISPVAAYDERSDSVLLLDVAGYLNPWYWVPVEHLYQAMHTRDGDNYRGYLVVMDDLIE
jgi:hypothetical protein